MSGLADRLRRAAASVGQALGGRRPGVELVRVDQPSPATPSPQLALPAPAWPVCRRCGTRHEPRPLPRGGGRGLAAAYSQQLLPDPNRPPPMGRDRFNPWRAHPAAVPSPPGPMTRRERIAGWWRGDEPTT